MNPPLPPAVQEIADVIGVGRALYLVGQAPRFFGGRSGGKSFRAQLYVPHHIPNGHPLVQLLGRDDATSLNAVFAGELLKLPTCAAIYNSFRNAAVRRLSMEGISTSELAEIMQLKPRQVRNILRQ